MKEKESVHDNKKVSARDFLELATKDRKRSVNILKKNRPRDLKIIHDYLDSPATYTNVGERYRISRQRTEQIIKHAFGIIYENSSSDLKNKVPSFENIRFRKPPSLEFKIRRSIARGSKAYQVMRILEKDRNVSFKEIKKRTGIKGTKLSLIRNTLRGWGFNLPVEKRMLVNLPEKLQKAKNDSEVQQLLNQIRRGHYNTLIREENPCITPVKSVASPFFNFSNREVKFFAKALIKAKVPLRQIKQLVESESYGSIVRKYYFIASKDIKRSQTILLKDSKLKRFRK